MKCLGVVCAACSAKCCEASSSVLESVLRRVEEYTTANHCVTLRSTNVKQPCHYPLQHADIGANQT
eukprot:7931071-Alexandrium_andersonii.AAC.1